MKIPDKLKSRKLWITIGTATVAVLNAAFDWGIAPEVGGGLALVVATYLFGQSWVDKSEVTEIVKVEGDFMRKEAIAYARQLEMQLAAVAEEQSDGV